MTDSPRGLPVKETIRLKSIRKSMAQSMKASVDTAALSQVTREVDVTQLQAMRASLVEKHEAKISLNSLLMTAIARTLSNHSTLNAELVDNHILVYDTVNLGVAVATDAGLVVVVVNNASRLSISEMSQSINGLAEKARTGTLSMQDVEGGTFTASNLGMYGIDSGFPIPRTPEGAIVLIGAAQAKPVVVDDEITIRQMVTLSLTFDHRFIDGATAASFLADLNDLITHPERLAEVP